MTLAHVSEGNPHVVAHNDERDSINGLLDLTSTGRLASGKVPLLDGSTPSDGQILVYSNTLGEWVPANASGNSELAYAENASGTVTSMSTTGGSGASVTIPSVSIVVPISTRAVWLEWGVDLIQTGTAQPGSFYLAVKEGATTWGLTVARLPNSTAADQSVLTVRGRTRLGTVAAAKTLTLVGSLYTAAGVTASANLLNGATNDQRSYLGAEAR